MGAEPEFKVEFSDEGMPQFRDVHGDPMHLRARELEVDRRYQRPMNRASVKRIAEEFDPYAIGMLTVSIRPDGSKIILDGQHRHAALLEMGWGDQMVPCFALRGLTLQQEARVFRVMNEGRRRVMPIDLFRTRLTEKDPVALDIADILASRGLRVTTGSERGTFRSIASALKIYGMSGRDVFRKVIWIVTDAWPNTDDNFAASSEMLFGLALLLCEYEDQVDVNRLVSVMALELPSNIISQARSLRATIGGSVQMAVATSLVNKYNRRLQNKERRLDPWASRPVRRKPLLPRSKDSAHNGNTES